MELRHLRYFVAVAEEQNVTRAAARLHVSQPPLSRQIRDLEAELGVALFEHKAKSLRLTEAGRVFLIEAKAVLQRADEAVQTLKAVASGQRGEIHIAYAPSLTVEVLPKALRSFQEANPGVRVQLYDLSTQEMLRGLRDGKLHVALLIQLSPKVLAGLVFKALRRYAVCVAVHPSHPLARARKVTLQQVARERLIAYTLADYPEYHAWLADLFAPLNVPPKIAEEHDSATSLIASVEAGRGVALVPQVFNCLTGPRLKILPITPAPAPFVIGIAWRQNETSAFVQKFVDAAKTIQGEGLVGAGTLRKSHKHVNTALTIKSYLLINRNFVEVKDWEKPVQDERYIDGAIVVTINGVEFLGFEHYDLVDQLWAYIINELPGFIENGDFKTVFPDQPIVLKFQANSSKTEIEMTIDVSEVRSAMFSYREFLFALLTEADAFFRKMPQLNPSKADTYNSYVREIKLLREKV